MDLTKKFSWILAFTILLLVLHCRPGSSQCPGTTFSSANVLETDPPGTSLLNITYTQNITWRVRLKPDQGFSANLTKYLNNSVRLTNEGDHYHLTLTMTLDVEDINENFYEFFVFVKYVNEYPPQFVNAPLFIAVPEGTRPNTMVLLLSLNATDRDVVGAASDIQRFEWTYHNYGHTSFNGSHYFDITNKQTGQISVMRELDYEAFDFPQRNLSFFIFNMTVYDNGGLNDTNATCIYVVDVDDQPPEFVYPGCNGSCIGFYKAQVDSTFTGALTDISPASIYARDRDTLNISVGYRIVNGPGNFQKYLSIDQSSGEVTVLRELGDIGKEQVVFTIRAEKLSPNRFHEDANLMITVDFPDTDPPTPGRSTQPSSLSNELIAVIVLALLVFIAFISLGGLYAYMKTRPDKSIHPEQEFDEDIEKEEEDNVDEDDDGQTHPDDATDSGHSSMNGSMLTGSPHAGSIAPAYTRMMLPNGQIVMVPLKGNGRRLVPIPGARGANPHMGADPNANGANLKAGGEEGVEEAAEGGELDGNVLHEKVSVQDVDARAVSPRMLANGGMMPVPENGIAPTAMPLLHMPNGMMGNVPMPNGHANAADQNVENADPNAHPQMMMSRGFPQGVVPRPMMMPNGQMMMMMVDAHGNPILNRQLPPMGENGEDVPQMEGRKKRMSKKKRKKLEEAMLKQQEFDGTREFPEDVDESFYMQGGKQKVKLSSRKKNTEPIEPKHRMEVEEDDVEQD